MTLQEVLSISATIIASIGGAGAIIIAFSTWLGKVWASRILEVDRLKYNSILEETKSNYQKELEGYKQQLERSKSLFFRYSEKQFTLYNDLWRLLNKLKITVDDLWENADLKNLMSFGHHLKKTADSIETHRLIIEDEHYKKLKTILTTLNKFKIGKETLITFRNLLPEDANKVDMSDIKAFIRDNEDSTKKYNDLLELIVDDFKRQIRPTL